MTFKKTFLIITFLALVLLSACSAKSIYEQSDIDINDVLVKVNSDYILKSDIDPIYEQYKGTTVTYKKIVEDSILEMLVVQSSSKYDTQISEKELDSILADFENSQPDMFKEAADENGIEKLRQKLKIRNTYSKTKEYVMDNILLKDKTISHDVIEQFKKENNLVEQLAPYSDEEIIQNLKKELEEFMFREWMLQLRDKADIEYLQDIPKSE